MSSGIRLDSCCSLIPIGTLLKTYGNEDGINLGELQRSAKNVLNFAINSTAMDRKSN